MSSKKRTKPSTRLLNLSCRYGKLTRVTCAFLILCILTISAPAAPTELKGYVSNTARSARFLYLSGTLAPKLLEIGWIGSQVISRVYKGAGIANRSFKRIDRVVVAR